MCHTVFKCALQRERERGCEARADGTIIGYAPEDWVSSLSSCHLQTKVAEDATEVEPIGKDRRHTGGSGALVQASRLFLGFKAQCEAGRQIFAFLWLFAGCTLRGHCICFYVSANLPSALDLNFSKIDYEWLAFLHMCVYGSVMQAATEGFAFIEETLALV